MLRDVALDAYKNSLNEWDVAVTLAGAPLDLTGKKIYFTIKYRSSDSDTSALCQLSTGSGITHTNGPAGLAKISLDAARTANATYSTYRYDMRLISDGKPYEIATGTLTLRPSVTAATS